MADINSVVLVGRLTRNIEIKYTNGGMAVGKLGIAVNRRRKQNDQWIEEASFFDITLWGKTAEALQSYLVKGKQIGVQGELRQSRWEQDGQARSRVEVVATNIQLLGGRGNGPGEGSQSYGQGDNQGFSGGSGFASGPQSSGPSNDDFEDDIPF
ncbi:MAG: single-stranded DNA-binding protein [Spirochaetales bacterium]|nr:single-stranded DNA-binding protein [Spirochaetales bacterium]